MTGGGCRPAFRCLVILIEDPFLDSFLLFSLPIGLYIIYNQVGLKTEKPAVLLLGGNLGFRNASFLPNLSLFHALLIFLMPLPSLFTIYLWTEWGLAVWFVCCRWQRLTAFWVTFSTNSSLLTNVTTGLFDTEADLVLRGVPTWGVLAVSDWRSGWWRPEFPSDPGLAWFKGGSPPSIQAKLKITEIRQKTKERVFL